MFAAVYQFWFNKNDMKMKNQADIGGLQARGSWCMMMNCQFKTWIVNSFSDCSQVAACVEL